MEALGAVLYVCASLHEGRSYNLHSKKYTYHICTLQDMPSYVESTLLDFMRKRNRKIIQAWLESNQRPLASDLQSVEKCRESTVGDLS